MHGVQDKLKAVLAWHLHLLPPCSAKYTAGPCALSLQAAPSLASQGPVRPCRQPAKTKLCGATATMEGMMVPWWYKVGSSAELDALRCISRVCVQQQCHFATACTVCCMSKIAYH